VDREGEDGVVPGRQRCGAVTLMHVEIEDQDPPDRALRDQPVGGHCQIVEHAIARAAVVQCMMAAARAVRGKAMVQRQQRGEPGAAGRKLRSQRHRPR
jgi:hypothetical protein